MTVGELKQILQELEDTDEVRFAHQPHWPFEYAIDRYAYSIIEKREVYEYDDKKFDEDGYVLYLSEGRQIGYLPGVVKEELGW